MFVCCFLLFVFYLFASYLFGPLWPFRAKTGAHFETCSRWELENNVGMPTLSQHCRKGAVTRGKRAKKPIGKPRNHYHSRVIGSWTTNTDWHGPISRAGRPTPSRAQVRHAPSRRAAEVKCPLFCRTLRQAVRQRRGPSLNQKSTNDNIVDRLSKWCVHIVAGCGATCEQSDGSIRHSIHQRQQAPRQ